MNIEKDQYGTKLKYPERQCKACLKYPCFPEIEKCSSDFAAYGCLYYKTSKLLYRQVTILARLLAKEEDVQGYITYVFECLDEEMIKETKYIMCTRFPNWDHRDISLGEVGYLKFFEVQAGIDKWFDGQGMVPYRYNGCHFIKFIKRPEKIDRKFRI